MLTLRINVAGLLKEPVGGARDAAVGADPLVVRAMLPEGRATKPLVGTVRLLRSPRSIFARVRASTEVALECSRCLEDAISAISLVYDAEYFPSIDVATGGSLSVPADDLAFVIDHNHELDLAEPTRQELIVALPMHPLCREDCAGLCAGCFRNRNLEDCICEDEPPDPRLDILRNMLTSASDTLATDRES